MKLTELDPGFVSASTTDSTLIGVHFLCPKCKEQQLYIPFADPTSRLNWKMSGESIEVLTLAPSIDSKHVNGGYDGKPRVECHWHGFVTNGEIKTV